MARARARTHTHTHTRTHAHTHAHMHTCTRYNCRQGPRVFKYLTLGCHTSLFCRIYRSLLLDIQVTFTGNTGLFYRSLLQDIQVSFLSNRALLPAGKDPEFLKYLTLGAEMSLCNIGIYRDGFNYSVPVLFFFSFLFFLFFLFRNIGRHLLRWLQLLGANFFSSPPLFFLLTWT